MIKMYEITQVSIPYSSGGKFNNTTGFATIADNRVSIPYSSGGKFNSTACEQKRWKEILSQSLIHQGENSIYNLSSQLTFS